MIIRKLHRLAKCIEISAEVRNALEVKKPVVALESTIITHGMPYPHNKETALGVEQIIREQNAIPATIAIVKGKLKVGLTPEEFQLLATSNDVVKTSRRDIPYVLSQGLSGGTTVAGTMVAADIVGIKVFVTGGLGGVHRGGEQTMDISADLTELGRTPIAVVCSGIKSILDIGRSLEYLETQGVCVATFGSTRHFPAFYCQKSKHKAPYNVASVEEAAALIQSASELHLRSGLVIAVPVPEEYQLVDDETIEIAIQKAIKMAAEKNILGKAVTPFILEQLAEFTKGCSLQTNIALIKNNALVGAKIAVALNEGLRNSEQEMSPRKIALKADVGQKKFTKSRTGKRNPVVIGGSILDSVVSVEEPFKVEGITLKGRIRQSGGGVGRNLADAIGKLGLTPTLVTAVGDDPYGHFLLHQTISHLDHSGVMVSSDLPTASFSVVLDQRGEFRLGVGDMDIHSLITPDHISSYLEEASAVVFDGNLPTESISFILEFCSTYNIPVIFEPTDVAKAAVPFQFETWKSIRLITPNVKELRTIASFIGLDVGTTNDEACKTTIEEVVSMATPLAEHIQTVLVTLGALGVVLVGRTKPEGPVTGRYYPTSPLHNVNSASGAGDCLAAAAISGLLTGLNEPQYVTAALSAALDSLHCYAAVPNKFSPPPLTVVQHCLVGDTLKKSLL